MSITQTYYLAHKARSKLSREAAQPDHDLRLLVGHANLLDTLMLELADAESEQERWFNQSVRKANPKSEERRVQWADRAVEESRSEDESDSESESDSDDDYQEDIEMHSSPYLSPLPNVEEQDELEDPEEDPEDDPEADCAHLELVRTGSHANSPPELVDHDSESSDDESMPPSPEYGGLEFDDKQVVTAEYPEQKQAQSQDYAKDYYNPSSSGRLVTVISVY